MSAGGGACGSGTPLARKLGVGEGALLALVHAPPGVEGLLAPLPAGARTTRRLTGTPALVLLFTTSARDLGRELDRLRARLAVDGALWVAWPKRASGVPTDVTEDVVRDAALACGLVDVKVCAIDDTWSGLRLVVPRADRARIAAARLGPRPRRSPAG